MRKKRNTKITRIDDFQGKYKIYIMKVLKQVHPDTGMSSIALATLENIICVTVMKLVEVTNNIFLKSEVKTISSRDIQTAVRIVFPGELAKHAVSEGQKAVTKFNAGSDVREKKETRAKSAGLTFNVARIEKLMFLVTTAPRKSKSAAIYLTAVLEYIIAEVIELAGNQTRDFKRTRITPRHIKLAILNDEELSYLFNDTIFSG